MSFPSFLILLPLIAVPIIIHLLSSRRLKKIDFPSLLFIVKNEVRLMKWFRLKRLLLLIARISLLIFLILSAVNLKIPFSFFDPGKTIILDNSPSMEKVAVKDKNGFIVPMQSGIPEFSSYFERNPVGILITDAQRNAFTEIIREKKSFYGIEIKKTSFPEGNFAVIGAVNGPGFEGEDFRVSFTVLNEYQEKRKTRFTFKSDETVIAEDNTILTDGKNTLDFSLSLKKGLHSLSLELEDEKGFYFDNTYYLAVNVKSRQNVCILSDKYPERLTAALSPSYFNVKWVRKISGIKEDLFISLNAEQKQLRDLLDSPNSGLICLGESENTSISNKIPNRISTIVNESLLKDFSDLKVLSQIPISYNSLITRGETLIYFKNGNPFISKLENHLILPFSPEENDLSLYPIFIPFLFNLIEYISEQSIYKNILLDEPITITSSFKPEIISPTDEKCCPLEMGNDNYIFKQTKECGIYKIVAGNKTIGLIAVNNHPSESELESLSDDELQYIFGGSGLSNGSSLFLIIALLCFVLTFLIERKT